MPDIQTLAEENILIAILVTALICIIREIAKPWQHQSIEMLVYRLGLLIFSALTVSVAFLGFITAVSLYLIYRIIQQIVFLIEYKSMIVQSA